MIPRRVVNFLSWVLTASVFVLGAATLRLSWGPIELPTVAEQLEERLNAELETWTLTVGSAAVEFDAPSGDVALVLRDVALADDQGAQIIAAPSALIGFDAAAALDGRLRIQRIDLRGVSALATRAEDGSLVFALEDDASVGSPEDLAETPAADVVEDADAASSRRLFAILGGADAPAALSTLQELSVRDSSVVLADAVSDRIWRLDEGALVLSRGEEGYVLRIDGALKLSNAGAPIPIALDGRLQDGATRADVRVSTPGVSLATLVDQYPELAPLSPVDGDLVAFGAFLLDIESGDISPIRGELRLEDGALRIDAADAAPIDRVRMDLFIDPAGESLQLRDIVIDAPGLELAGEAAVDILRGPRGDAQEVSVVINVSSGVFDAPDLLPEPVTIRRAAADFAFNVCGPCVEGDCPPCDAGAELRGAEIATDRVALRASGALIFGPTLAESTFDIEASGRDMAVVDIVRLWPLTVSPFGRAWVSENIAAGRIVEASIRFASAPDQQQSLTLRFAFEDGETVFMPGLPPVVGAAGEGVATLDRLEISLDAGAVTPPGFAPIDVAGSVFVIPEIAAPILVGEAEIRASGSIDGALALLDTPPLSLLSGAERDFSGLAGAFEAEATITAPLLKAAPLEDVAVAATATLRDVSVRSPELDGPFTASRLEVAADSDGATISGRGVYQGAPLRLRIREPFSEAGGPASSRVTLELGPRDFAEAGLSDVVESGAATVTIDLDPDDPAGPIDLRVDLTEAALALDVIGWRKAAGVAASATATARPTRGGGWRVERLSAELGDLAFRGSGVFGADGSVRELRLDPVTIGEGTAFTLWTEDRGDDLTTFVARGPRIDLSGLSPGDRPGRDSPPYASFAFDFDFETVRFGPNAQIENFAAAGTRLEDGRLNAAATASAGGAMLRAVLSPTGAADQQIELRAEPAGTALRALDLFGGANGGVLALTAVDDGGALRGEVLAQDIVLRDAPFLAELVSYATGLGIFDRLGSGGTTFSRVSVPFRMTTETIVIRDGVATGPSLGISFSGEVDRVERSLDIDGTLSPANIINQVVREVPLIGDLIAGDGGIVGISFAVRGSIDDPQTTTNPLSALTPGPFRDILSIDNFDVDSTRPRQPRDERFD